MRRALLLAVLLARGLAAADEFHYQGFPTGSRAAGMGGAFTALGTDSSTLFYNPAGLVLSPGTELSLSTSVYSVGSDAISGNLSQQPPTFSTYPSTFALIKTPFWQRKDDPEPRHRYGITVLVTDHTRLSRELYDASGRIQLLNSTDETTYYGAGYSYRPWKWLCLGVSAFFIMRDHSELESRLAPAGRFDFALNRRELSGSHYALRFGGGALIKPSEQLSLGLSVRSESLGISGSLSSTEFEKLPGAFLTERTSTKGIFTNRLPWTWVAGIAVHPHPTVTLSADVSYNAALGTYRVFQTDNFFEEVHKKAVANFALGAEWLVRDWLPLRIGFYTDKSSREGPALTGQLAQASPDLFAFTGSFGYELHRATLILGGAYAWGSTEFDTQTLSRQEIRWWIAASYRL